MKHKDGFMLMHADLPDQLAYAPDEEVLGLDEDGWFEAYHAFETHSEAKEDALDTVWTKVAASGRGDIADDYETAEDVPPEAVKRVRVFEDGTLALYACDPDHGEDPEISDRFEAPERLMTPEVAYEDFGMTPPVSEPVFSAGTHACRIQIRVSDPVAFAEDFGAGPEDISEAILRERVFVPALDEAKMGARLLGAVPTPETDGFSVVLTAEITEPRLFQTRVAEAARETGRDRDWSPKDAAEAIFEGWFGANDTGSPADSGFEVVAQTAVPDADSDMRI